MDSPTAYPTGQDKAGGITARRSASVDGRGKKRKEKDLELTIMKSHVEVKAIRNKLEEITYKLLL
jgi:hypothetical protein